ncbi:hypothetical protein HDU83_003276 [Entophlyctis luteolus]|nr:hypothetical protein HDU83_003276 [Entophlyctis luteolus]
METVPHLDGNSLHTMDLEGLDHMPWTRRFFVLPTASKQIYSFVNSSAAHSGDPYDDVFEITATTIVVDKSPFIFELFNRSSDKVWMLKVNMEMVKSLWIDSITTMISRFPLDEYSVGQREVAGHEPPVVLPVSQRRAHVSRARSRVLPTRLHSLPQGGGTYLNQNYSGITSPASSPMNAGRRNDDVYPRSMSFPISTAIPAVRLTYTAADNHFVPAAELPQDFTRKSSDVTSFNGSISVGIPGGGVFGSMIMDDDDDVRSGTVEVKTTKTKNKKEKSPKAAVFEKPHTYQPMKAFIF